MYEISSTPSRIASPPSGIASLIALDADPAQTLLRCLQDCPSSGTCPEALGCRPQLASSSSKVIPIEARVAGAKRSRIDDARLFALDGCDDFDEPVL